MHDIVNMDSGEVLPYERGLPRTIAIRAVLRRFLPGGVLALSPFVGLAALQSPMNWIGLLPTFGLMLVSLTGGYGLGLELLRRSLYPDARVDERRSLVAGVCAPLLLGIASMFTQEVGLWGMAGVGVLVGITMAVLMFFPWLTPTPESDRARAASTEREGAS
jgi:hypothetical protein